MPIELHAEYRKQDSFRPVKPILEAISVRRNGQSEKQYSFPVTSPEKAELREVLGSEEEKIGWNLLILDTALAECELEINGSWFDTALAEYLIDENRSGYTSKGIKSRYKANTEEEAFRAQWEILKEQGLIDAYNLDAGLFTLYRALNRQGIRFDEGFAIEIKKEADYERRNSTGERQAELEHLISELDKLIPRAKNGRIYPEIHPFLHSSPTDKELRGYKTGRIGYSNPNLQSLPSIDVLSDVKALFIPEEGCFMGGLDYSQQEIRLLAHYSACIGTPNGLKLADRFNTDPNIDPHAEVAAMADLPRSVAKTLNFGVIYGLGKKRLKEEIGEEFEAFLSKYNEKFPQAKELREVVSRKIEVQGFVRTLAGRKQRFDEWVPKQPFGSWRFIKPSRKENIEKTIRMLRSQGDFETASLWENGVYQRYKAYTGLSRLLQASGADFFKTALLKIWKEFPEPRIFSLLNHDALCGSFVSQSEMKRVKEIMVTAIPLKVPMTVKTEIGENYDSLCEIVL
jgi:DNA polymerase I-like protein with 3'-5' exonuclease and polymerase domains